MKLSEKVGLQNMKVDIKVKSKYWPEENGTHVLNMGRLQITV